MKALIAAIAIAGAALAVPASAASVHGSLVQQSVRTVRPVSNMLITLRSEKNVRSARVYTDRSGEFWFYDVPRGRYIVEIWRNGMDDSTPQTQEVCRIEVAGADVTLPRLRLHNSPMRPNARTRSCGDGLEHLYLSG